MRNTTVTFLALFALSILSGVGAETSGWRLLIEPAFMSPPLAWKIPGAQRTVLVPALDASLEPVPLDRIRFLKLRTNKSDFTEKSRENASAALAKLSPRWVRDKDGVILYARLESDNGLAASTVLAPGFPNLFKEYLGEDLLLAIPHRDLVYIFSRQDPQYRYMSEEINDVYHDAIYPVSTEAFILKNGTLEAVGEFLRGE